MDRSAAVTSAPKSVASPVAAEGRATPTLSPGSLALAARADSRHDGCRIGQLYAGPVSDRGWAASHVEGLRVASRDLPAVDSSLRRESVPIDDEPLAERALDDLVASGAAVVFATAPGFSSPARKAAARHPSVPFLVAGGSRAAGDLPNLGFYYGLVEEARFITGEIAGLVVEPGANLGYVVPVAAPPVFRGLNAFALGVARTNPTARIHLGWTGSWFDPRAERRAAERLLALPVQAAMIAQEQYSPAPQLAAEAAGKLGLGHHVAMSDAAPRAALTGAVWSWGGYYRAVIEAVCSAAWSVDGQARLPEQFRDWLGSLRDGTVTLAPLNVDLIADHPRREEIRKLYLDEITRFRSSEKSLTTIFTGPIRDNTGQPRIQGRPDLNAVLAPDARWLVENVVGAPEP